VALRVKLAEQDGVIQRLLVETEAAQQPRRKKWTLGGGK
jgi:hypothetical protein